MRGQVHDLVVIGGGIHGVGVAQAAAAAGHKVLLLEKQTLAYGTSSRSSKLIHGGLRYLESFQLGLVFESLSERKTLLRLAPELVKLRRFHLPVYRQTRRRPWQLTVGLSLYAILSGLGPGARFGRIPRSKWGELDGLSTDGLQAVYYYHDGQTDDRRLTRAVMASAQSLGAELAAPAEFLGATLRASGSHPGIVRYRSGDAERECHARVIVNAAGPWVNEVLARIEPAPAMQAIELVQGTHIRVRGRLDRGLYYVESPRDGRAVFVMPWYGNVLVGTTETRFHGNPGAVKPLRAERAYLLRVLAHYFPRYRDPAAREVLEAFAGLRVLPAGSGHAFHRSRETILLVHPEPRGTPPQLLSIYGGKFTGYRATAEKVLSRLRPALPSRAPVADTRELPLEPVAE